ncbi:MAG: ATP-dependent sacrificial sulfur transferase LarE [Planctomycetota bacterium]|nr:ATP-dependent sacrificial sulfur transferase LarE [Planctomycetota bacterium]
MRVQVPPSAFVNLQDKYNSLKQILKGFEKVVVAYSGGVDSTFLLKTAVDTLGKQNVLACIAVGATLPDSQYKQALENAKKSIGIDVITLEPAEISDPAFSSNKADRCFHCKTHLLRLLTDLAKKNKIQHILCGNNFDDKDDYRPGSRAMNMFGIKCPLADAQLTKAEIRQLSRQLNLPTADIPASPCLASRISYGLEITEERLRQIEDAEDFLRSLGLVEFRVRHHDTIARIEVHPQDMEKITKDPNRSAIIEKLKSLGFKFVTIDLQGFRSGSMNEVLPEREKSPDHRGRG